MVFVWRIQSGANDVDVHANGANGQSTNGHINGVTGSNNVTPCHANDLKIQFFPAASSSYPSVFQPNSSTLSSPK
jgi:hypothetical protein